MPPGSCSNAGSFPLGQSVDFALAIFFRAVWSHGQASLASFLSIRMSCLEQKQLRVQNRVACPEDFDN